MANYTLLEAVVVIREAALKRMAEAKDVISQAQLTMSQARSDLEKIDAFMSLWREHVGAETVPELAHTTDVAAYPIINDAPDPTPSKRAKGNARKEQVAQAALDIIRERGEPIQRAPLFAAVVKRGLIISGSDPEMVFSTMLWRMKDVIKRIPDFGYWDAKIPFAPANYDPSRKHEVDDEEMASVQQDIRDEMRNEAPKSLSERMVGGLTEEMVEGWSEKGDEPGSRLMAITDRGRRND